MLRLAPIKGRYSVGATTFVTPVRPARVFGSAKRRGNNASSPDQPEPVLCMEEVAFTAYYPADTSSVTQKDLHWLLRPASVSLQGYSAFTVISTWILWPIVYFVGIFVKIPVYANAPLLRPGFGRPVSEITPHPDQWPLVIFSHGLGGSRTAYSHLCSHLAASGKVVLAIEHRDASGHACVTRSWLDNGQKVPRSIYYLKENQAIWEGGPTDKERVQFALRIEQLDFRRNEVYTTYSTFRDFLEQVGPSVNLETIDGSETHHSWTLIDDEAKLSPIKYQEDISLVGHSFGGCTVLSILSTESPLGHEAIPTTRALLLDPWLEPLPTPGPKPHSRTNPELPGLLVINSEAFTVWEPHFSRLQEVITTFAGKIITLVGSKHQSFSDFPVLPFVKTKEAVKHLDTIVSASLSFLDSDLEQFLKEAPTRATEVLVVGVKDDGKPKRKLVGDVGDIVTH